MTFKPFFMAAALMAPTMAGAAVYSASPATPVAAKRIVQRDISWACGPAACQGATDYGRPLILCQRLAREVGPIGQFLIDGRALSGTDLARCNESARVG